MKTEILNAIKNTPYTFDWIDFNGSLYESKPLEKQIETENYLIDLEITVTVKFESHEFYELDSEEISNFVVRTQDEIVIDNELDTITEEEILNVLTINV